MVNRSSRLSTDLSVARLGKPNGFAPLGPDSKIPAGNLPAGVASNGLVLQGTYNASTNTPDLTLVGNQVDGHLYIVEVAGTQDIGNGSESFSVGDTIFWSDAETKWYHLQGSVLATEVSYDNTSGLTATNTQDAIDELASLSNTPETVPITASSTTFTKYLNPTGNDTNDGNSVGTPWQTLDRLKQFVQGLNPKGGTVDVIVNFADGTYGSASPIVNFLIYIPDNVNLVLAGNSGDIEAVVLYISRLVGSNSASSSYYISDLKLGKTTFISSIKGALENIAFSSSSTPAIFALNASIDFAGRHVITNSSSSSHISAQSSNISFSFTEIEGGVANTFTNSFLSASQGSIVTFSGTTLTGLSVSGDIILNTGSILNETSSPVLPGAIVFDEFSGTPTNNYDNTTSGLTATTKQDAIDEVTTGKLTQLPGPYADDVAASGGGVAIGQLYYTASGGIQIRLT